MDEFVKQLVEIQRKIIEILFEQSRATMDYAKALREGDPVKIQEALIVNTELQAKYLARMAALSERQLEQTTRMMEDEGGGA